ncbi:amino acid-binding protein [Roseospira marina]|uniref:Amino acid-binding protein n=1 Tax=Roseospira marina TaxID=140057 RepID=A0A5M6IAE6_9PROT|nr:ACT domain-containing protein [Roseospira marina]KAA5604638.1 amino acid-binding protein [Roseospira marina]MBB4315080.1 glycine cleavage system transcriptional repressor [Roseospira marina]MBB5088150.1 glycine cleavage system transcriptional repressor [Roseospira marina]
MPHSLHVQVFCSDRTGLVAGLTGALFDLGANLGDARFAVLGQGAEFSAVVTVPDETDAGQLRDALAGTPEAEGAEVTVTPYDAWAGGPGGSTITHRVFVSGGDRPGLVTRMAEVFGDFEANIATLNAQQMPHDPSQYLIRFAVAIPPERTAACLATISNTAESLGLGFRVETA